MDERDYEELKSLAGGFCIVVGLIIFVAEMAIGILLMLMGVYLLRNQIKDYIDSEISSRGIIDMKHCGNCGRKVPFSSHAGQHCPYCSVYWSDEKMIIQ